MPVRRSRVTVLRTLACGLALVAGLLLSGAPAAGSPSESPADTEEARRATGDPETGSPAPESAPPAPEWAVSEWLNGDPGRLADHRGRVVLMHFFQLWCPGCNHFSIPLFNQWDRKYGGREDVLILSIHSVFEGHSIQTPRRLRHFVAEKEIRHPVGIDAYDAESDHTPVTMRRYRTGGTPHVVILDRQGNIRFSQLGRFDTARVETLIDQLLDEGNSGARRASTRPDPRLSGVYLLRLEQRFKSCGPVIRPVVVEVPLEFFGDRVEASLPEALLGLRNASADFDPESGALAATFEQLVDLGEMPAVLALELEGQLHDDGESPEIEITFRFRKFVEDPEWDCEVTGVVRGPRVRGPRVRGGS